MLYKYKISNSLYSLKVLSIPCKNFLPQQVKITGAGKQI